jgi:tRNA uridine 5-carboxymethylaminomethyl modification enzyme
MNFKYDIIVIGAGHAGCEAAAAAANLGSKTLLITMDLNKIAQMSCNPAIGGIAKGQIVREIDALGGYMGIVSDRTSIQFRMLNKSKGPAMWSPRSQNDRTKFSECWRSILESIPNLYLWQDSVSQLLVDTQNNAIQGIETALGVKFFACAVIFTPGTFLNGLIHVGKNQISGGRLADAASYGLTEQIASFGIETDRLKTGTPVRVDIRSIHLNDLDEQPGENTFHKFSYLDTIKRDLKSLSCWTLYTNTACHNTLRERLEDSPMYNGQITSIGPRYCPSIETKIVTFSQKTQHQLFLEPEGETFNEYYLNGFSSSLPFEVQLKALKKIPEFQNIQIIKPGYAIEYDYFNPTQLYHTLESKLIKNLFFAGQINGTTGYEEASGQGLIAGINAHINCHGGNRFILRRNEAYIGVLIDDLVTKGVDEPYRMFTSRAEYRTLLRQDNADMRLTEKSYQLGLASMYRYNLLEQKKAIINNIIEYCKTTSIKPGEVDTLLEESNTTKLNHGCKLIEIIKRPQVILTKLIDIFPQLSETVNNISCVRKEEIIEAAEITMKYSGYIERENQIAQKISRLENIGIKGKFDYDSIQSLSTEARQKLRRVDPETIAQASRIPGISPSDINILLVLLGR